MISNSSSSKLGISSSVSSERSIVLDSFPKIANSSTKSVGKNGFLKIDVKPSTSSASLEHIYKDLEYLTLDFISFIAS